MEPVVDAELRFDVSEVAISDDTGANVALVAIRAPDAASNVAVVLVAAADGVEGAVALIAAVLKPALDGVPYDTFDGRVALSFGSHFEMYVGNLPAPGFCASVAACFHCQELAAPAAAVLEAPVRRPLPAGVPLLVVPEPDAANADMSLVLREAIRVAALTLGMAIGSTPAT